MLTSKVTVQSFSAELEDILEKKALDVTLPMIMGGVGALGGGMYAHKTTKDPSKKLRNTIIAALLAGPGAYALTKAIQGGGASAEGKPRSYVQGQVAQPARPSPIPDETTQLTSIPSRQGWVRGEGPISIRGSVNPRTMPNPASMITPVEQALQQSFPGPLGGL